MSELDLYSFYTDNVDIVTGIVAADVYAANLVGHLNKEVEVALANRIPFSPVVKLWDDAVHGGVASVTLPQASS